jgi:hypothetical protein
MAMVYEGFRSVGCEMRPKIADHSFESLLFGNKLPLFPKSREVLEDRGWGSGAIDEHGV